MKKIIAVILAMAMVLGLSACGGPKPEDTVKAFCESMKNYDEAGMKACLAEQGEIDSVNEEVGGDLLFGEADVISEKMTENAQSISYKIGKAAVNGDAASVPVDFEYNDISGVISGAITDIFGKLFEMMFSGDPNAEDEFNAYVEQTLNDRFAAAEPVRAASSVTFSLIKAGDEWKIANLDDETVNVLTGNMLKALDDIGDALAEEFGSGWETQEPVDFPISDELLFENEECSMSIVNGGTDEWGDAYFMINCENRTADKDLTFSIDHAVVNGWNVGGFFYEDVAPGKSSNATFNIYSSDLERLGIDSPDRMKLNVQIYNSEDWWEGIYIADEYVTVYPTGLSDAQITVPARPSSPDETVIADTDDFTFIILGEVEHDFYPCLLDVYIKNKSSIDLEVDWDNVSVNGFMADPYFGIAVPAGEQLMTSISFSDEDFDNNGIEAAEEIEFEMTVRDRISWDSDPLFDETLIYRP